MNTRAESIATAQPEARAISLRVLSYNMQVALQTAHYGHYLTRAWRHALPGPGMHLSLDQIAELLREHDFVALQEADHGSLRTQFTNQIEYLARRSGFAHCGLTVTRKLKPFAAHALGFLSRYAPEAVEEHVLPSWLPGRRAMQVRLGADAGGLQLLLTHLSLGQKTQLTQIDYLNSLVPDSGPVMLLGDLNCRGAILRRHLAQLGSRLQMPDETPATYPSWRPQHDIDHILHTADIHLRQLRSLPFASSDHLPLAAEVVLRPQVAAR